MSHDEQHLEHHGIRPTAVRLLVWREIAGQTEAFTLHDLEQRMPQMDRSSIFRALRLFAEHKLLHEIDDGLGQQKYCLCRCEDSHHPNHVHFSCIRCGQTYCFEDVKIPSVALPEGFLMDETEYVIKGICPHCQ